MTKDISGNYIGQRSSMFSYSKLWLVSFERYEELVIEFATKWDATHKKKKLATLFPSTDPDAKQNRDNHVRLLVDKQYMHIKHFDDHLIAEGNRIFAGTETADTWCLYSDGLIQYWTKGNMEYLESKGFGNRLWRAEGETNVDNRYKGKVVGDSPEVNVGTDNDGFKDFGVSMAFHVGLSFLYDVNDERKFSLSTIPAITSTMSRY